MRHSPDRARTQGISSLTLIQPGVPSAHELGQEQILSMVCRDKQCFPMSRNTILTSIYGLSADAVEPFFYSLRLSGCEDNAVVFATKISDDCRAVLKKYGATVIESDYHGLPMAYSGLARRVWLALKATCGYYRNHRRGEKDASYLFVNCWRFFCFRDYLSKLDDKPALVLLADVRDVVFQRNPFSFPFQPGLSVASECTQKTISGSRGNTKWLLEAVGFREMRKIAHRTAVCAGTTMADYSTITKYLDLMTAHLNRRFFWALFDSLDQGLHNYFVHNQLVTPLHLCRNWNGPFLTLDSEVVLPENKTPDGYLCNKDGSIIPIVHQYDRIKALYRPNEPLPRCWKITTDFSLARSPSMQ